jgi:DNA-binding IclR family transcriptional regulator
MNEPIKQAKIAPIQVIDRMSTLLDALAAHDGGSALKLLAAETGLHPSSAFRILGSLIQNGFVVRDASGRYLLGPRLLQLASKVRAGRDLHALARPVMERLRDRIGETVNLTVREGDEMVYVERVTPNRMMRVEQVIGSRAPLHVTAVGKMMLGESGAAAIRDYARRTKLPAYTANTLKSAAALLRNISAILVQGYAYDDEEAELGVGCIGTLIRDASGIAVAGLSVSAPIKRRQQEWAAWLVDAAETISAQLGYARNGT